ncbi:S49 family peptidase [Mucilaginibacter sp.]|uniref:S49 family peptidase n=1 Tax=Mucilaginibacter sp. TaxID=1882438 RepID=UPI00262500C7|nr:S49 family peptidase [Mucilaginibacter sp.]MDB4919836.1 Serine protease, ClpP class [Mucilaginibacter sp.]
MSLKLISALAKDYWAITEDAVNTYFPIAQSILNGTHVLKAETLADDEFEPVDLDDDNSETIASPDSYTGRIAVMSIIGVLMHYGGPCSYGAVDYANRIDEYRNDESIAGLIVKGDGPGGQVQGTKTLREAFQRFAAVKPLITIVDDGVVASALVWAFSPSTEIYCSNAICEFGSVGIVACFMDVRKAMEMNGIKQVVIYAPQSTQKNKDFQDALDGKPAAVIAKLKFVCETFITDVADDRADKIKADTWKNGEMFFAEEAVTIGLIDGIKSYTEVVARMQELIAQNQNENIMLQNKLPKVAALKGATLASAADLQAANEDIEAYGIAGVTLCLDSELEALQSSAETIAGLQTTATANTALIAAKDGEINTLKAEKVALQAKLDGRPAVEVTGTPAPKDVIAGEVVVDAFETSVDKEAKALQAQW